MESQTLDSVEILKARLPEYLSTASGWDMGTVAFAQLLSHVRLFATPWTATRLASCPSPSPGVYSNSGPFSWWCHPTVSSSDVRFSSYLQSFQQQGLFKWVALCIRWPKYWSLSINISPSNEHPGLTANLEGCLFMPFIKLKRYQLDLLWLVCNI